MESKFLDSQLASASTIINDPPEVIEEALNAIGNNEIQLHGASLSEVEFLAICREKYLLELEQN